MRKTFSVKKWQDRLPFWAAESRLSQSVPHLSRPCHSFLRRAKVSMSKLFPFSLLIFGCAVGRCEIVSTAFFYGSPVPIEKLLHYKRVVVEAENLPDPTPLTEAGVTVFAYLSVGEAEGWRASMRDLDVKWFLGKNAAWGSRVVDLTQPGWGLFLMERRMAALWEQGYRGFFLDTLDSYQLAASTPAEQVIQEHALANIIRAMHKRFPGVQLLLNRGFSVLPEISDLASGVVAESLFQGWDATTKSYYTTSEEDRSWLLARLREINERYALPITVIDYVDPEKPELACETAQQIEALGFAPWIATPGLDTISLETNK